MVLRILLITIVYQFILVFVAFVFGEFKFFWNFVRKFLKRLGISSQQELNQFIENNPDVQDLSIKVSFEINDKNVFEFEDNIKK